MGDKASGILSQKAWSLRGARLAMMMQDVTDVDPSIHLHRSPRRAGVAPAAPPSEQTSHQLRGGGFRHRALRPAVVTAPSLPADGSASHPDCGANRRQSLDQEALAELVKVKTRAGD